MLFNLFDDVLLLHFTLEAAQRILERLTFLNNYFCHAKFTSSLFDCAVGERRGRGPIELHSACSNEARHLSQAIFMICGIECLRAITGFWSIESLVTRIHRLF